jgi:hypothetical protein
MASPTLFLSAAAATAALAVFAMPKPAHACGGTFCDAGPTAMPVDQTGENILFVMSGDSTEAHIQIQYDPDAEAAQFAWVVPMLALPTFSVGSEQLFQNLLAGTVPAYGFQTTFGCDDFGDDGGGGETGAAGDGGESSGGDTGGGPEVVFEDTVGAFDIVVLSGGTSMEVMQWLADNDYQQDPAAEPILQEYLDEGYLFAAFRLTNGAETAEIHPIVLTFSNDEACVPIRLTRIAAQDDMDVRTFFLADNRVVPTNYKHVLVNPLKLDWVNNAANYKEVITLAVDADMANGHAFVTEYAGDSAVVSPAGVFSAQWNAAPFETVDPVGVIDLLEGQGLVSCFEGGFGTSGGGDTGGGQVCQYNHTLIRGLLQQYLPVPASVEEGEFYGCLSCYEGLIDLEAWDGPAFAQAVQERIIDPGAHAQSLLDGFPYLTRMYTTISPAEMTEDPFFYQNPDLSGVDLTSQIATRSLQCDAAAVWTLPDGRVVYAPDANVWPDFAAEMPWEEDIEDTPEMGAPIGVVDNTDLINEQLDVHNCQFDYPSPEACGNATEDSSTGNDTNDPGDDGTMSAGGSASAGDTGDTDGAGQDGGDGSGGCGCTQSPTRGAAVLSLLLLGLLGRLRRRAA